MPYLDPACYHRFIAAVSQKLPGAFRTARSCTSLPFTILRASFICRESIACRFTLDNMRLAEPRFLTLFKYYSTTVVCQSAPPKEEGAGKDQLSERQCFGWAVSFLLARKAMARARLRSASEGLAHLGSPATASARRLSPFPARPGTPPFPPTPTLTPEALRRRRAERMCRAAAPRERSHRMQRFVAFRGQSLRAPRRRLRASRNMRERLTENAQNHPRRPLRKALTCLASPRLSLLIRSSTMHLGCSSERHPPAV